MDKLYAVIKMGGEYENSYTHIVGVCSTLEIADLLKDKVETKEEQCSISEEEWNIMYDALDKWEEEHEPFNSIFEGMCYLFPDKDIREIQKAVDFYYDNISEDTLYVYVEEINFYNNITDID